ncbi:MAG: xylitol oxidase [Candidatus Aldehydirespiratoraceae bacterium]|jgi:xylitol oxidase
MSDMPITLGTNWGGNHTYRASLIARPSRRDDLRQLVGGTDRLAAVGSRHSFNTIGDADSLVDLSGLSTPPDFDPETGLVAISGSTTYTDVAFALSAAGRALHNLASLPHISVAGGVATGTHGSGSDVGNLATAVEAIELLTSVGDFVTLQRGDPDFEGAVVNLGALGLVTQISLRTEPAFDVAQTVHDGLSWATLTGSFDEIMSSATSVSVFTRWGDAPGELWRKQRTDVVSPVEGDLFGTSPAMTPRHPIPGIDASACTEQGGRPGAWWNRLPHFRADAVPSNGAEIQSECFVDRGDSAAAIEALRSIGPQLADTLMISEIRTIAADDYWMSPCHARTSTAFHFTWKLDPPAVADVVELVGQALAPFGVRHHWGKAMPSDWGAFGNYERLADFLRLKQRLDPTNTFTTPWFSQHIG